MTSLTQSGKMITGEPPFPGLSDITVQFKIYRGEGPLRPTPERCCGYPVSDNLWTIVARCLSRTPEDRPFASEVLAELVQ
jgi:hypothetical protein